ncbi:hypothetical protein E2C01_030864 [Portunus trituberculatus]|uniref:Uncharacterized protein n=1 Tax=Portunus trituberculatus TaxID=210409 RepID=A0A5B7EWJ0_PORTR|nr:hypothetical protein [Portunus trituberculatus]
MASLGLLGERYISHRATGPGKDLNPDRLDRRPNHEHHPAPLLRERGFKTFVPAFRCPTPQPPAQLPDTLCLAAGRGEPQAKHLHSEKQQLL